MEEQLTVVDSAPVLTEAEMNQVKLQASTIVPRDVKKVIADVIETATEDAETAKACFYALTRKSKDGPKTITGPGVHLAILMASEWGNLFIKTAISEETKDTVKAIAYVGDIEKNNWFSFEDEMRTVDKSGKKYQLDQLIMTRKAVQSKALRGAIFRCIGKIRTVKVTRAVMAKAAGKGTKEPLVDRVGKMIAYFGKLKVSEDRILNVLDVKASSEITEEHLITLIGVSTAITDKETTIEEAFPPTPQEDQKAKGEQLSTSMMPDNEAKA